MSIYAQLFAVCNLAVLPFWLVLLIAPASTWGRFVRKWIPGVVLVAVGYAVLILPQIPELLPLVANPKLDVLLPLLGTEQGFVLLWLHVLAFDQLAAIWLVDRALDRGASRLFVAVLLVITLLFGPLGVLSFWISSLLPSNLITGRQPA